MKESYIHIWNIVITPGDCLLTFIRHVRENKGQLLIRNTLITPGDWFRSFTRHVRENEGELHIWNTCPSSAISRRSARMFARGSLNYRGIARNGA